MLTIQIDYRETDLLKNIQYLIETTVPFKELNVEVENLPLGDVVFIEKGENREDDKTHLMIERKTLGDLVSSIKDGRYDEQSYRLKGLNIHPHNILYLIEGDINKRNFFKENKEEKRMIFSAIFSLNYYKGFSVVRTITLEETALFICNSAVKLIKSVLSGKTAFYKGSKDNDNDRAGLPRENSENEDDKPYVTVIKKVKKDNITPENIGEIFLSQIPSISSITAIAIMKKGKNMANLINCIQKDNDFLKDVSYTDNKGKSRKISKKSIQNVYSFLTSEIIPDPDENK